PFLDHLKKDHQQKIALFLVVLIMAFRFRTVRNEGAPVHIWPSIGLSLSICMIGSANAQQPSCSISGGINNGIQIQNCPVIEQAPTPAFHVVQEFPIVENKDGTFTRSLLVQIDAPYVPNNM